MMPAIRFTVRYRLLEYVQLVSAHMQAELARRKRAEGKQLKGGERRLLQALLWLICPLMFFYKTLKVGACSFVIDEAGLVRACSGGQIKLPWSQVAAVYEYPAGYLVLECDGAMLVPFRALSPQQRVDLAALIQPYRGALV